MTTLVSKFSPKRTARTAGILYLVIFFANMFVFFMVSGALTVPGDAAATAGNIMASESLYRLGIAGYLLVFLSDLGVAVLFYIPAQTGKPDPLSGRHGGQTDPDGYPRH